MRQALEKTEDLPFDYIERVDFVPGWSSITLRSGLDLDIMTSLKGFPSSSFEACYNESSIASIYGIDIHFLHINHLIETKKQAVGPKDLIDLMELDQIRQQREQGL